MTNYFSEKDFQTLQKKFLEKYWNIFEPSEENKLIYTDIFQEYVSSILKIFKFLTMM